MDKGITTEQKSGEAPPQPPPQKVEEKDIDTSELPMKSSPYLNYDNLEDYKLKAYGAEGHQEVKEGRGAAASSDAPTLTGPAVSNTSGTDKIHAEEKTQLHSK